MYRVCLPHRLYLASSGSRYACLSVRCGIHTSNVKTRPLAKSSTVQEAKPGPFAVEHVGGRELHLSWSGRSGIKKRWRTLASAVEQSDRAITTRDSVSGKFMAWLTQTFLPTNYPQSVHPSYSRFHVLQFFETTISTLISVLCNQALLSSVGVSAAGSVFGAVAVQWIIKDGAGEVAKLFFIRRFSPYFDSHPKTCDFAGEAVVVFGSGLQLATLIVSPSPTNFLLCAAGGNIFKLIGNAIWLTTHIKFVRYFSQHGNTGDVAAKEESQASVAQLAGYGAGVGLLAFSHSAPYLYSIFFLALPVHLWISAWMLHVATFELLTVPRLSWLACSYAGEPHGTGRVISLKEMEARSYIGVFGEFYKTKEDKHIVLAPGVADVVREDCGDRARWEACADVFSHENYMLYPSASLNRPISILYHPAATMDDMLRSVLHAQRFRAAYISQQDDEFNNLQDLSALRITLEDTRVWTQKHVVAFKAALSEQGWRTDEIAFADHGHRVLWGSAAERAA